MQFPWNWYEMYKDLVVEEMVQYKRQCWPLCHRDAYCGRLRYPDQQVHLDTGVLRYLAAVNLSNSISFAYTLGEGPLTALNGKGCRSSKWLHESYRVWNEVASEAEIYDGRMPMACVRLSSNVLIKLFEHSSTSAVLNASTCEALDTLIVDHVRLCDQVESMLSNGSVEDTEHLQGARRLLDPAHSSLTPVNRAIIIIVPFDMSDQRFVIVVLIGHTNQMKGKAPDFTSTKDSEIYARLATNVVEVSLITATRFLHRIQRDEEMANEAWRLLNDARRKALQAKWIMESCRAVEQSRRDQNSLSQTQQVGLALTRVLQRQESS